MNDLTPEARAEIAAAIKILRDDGLHVHKTYSGFLKAQETVKTQETETEPKEGDPPPVKDTPTEGDKPKKKRGIGVWGNHDS